MGSTRHGGGSGSANQPASRASARATRRGAAASGGARRSPPDIEAIAASRACGEAVEAEPAAHLLDPAAQLGDRRRARLVALTRRRQRQARVHEDEPLVRLVAAGHVREPRAVRRRGCAAAARRPGRGSGPTAGRTCSRTASASSPRTAVGALHRDERVLGGVAGEVPVELPEGALHQGARRAGRPAAAPSRSRSVHAVEVLPQRAHPPQVGRAPVVVGRRGDGGHLQQRPEPVAMRGHRELGQPGVELARQAARGVPRAWRA